MKTADALRAEADKLLARAALLDSVPTEDPYGDGVVLTFEKTGGRAYARQKLSFAAIRAGGCWYTTGATGPQRVNWQRLIEFIGLEGLATVRRAAIYAPLEAAR